MCDCDLIARVREDERAVAMRDAVPLPFPDPGVGPLHHWGGVPMRTVIVAVIAAAAVLAPPATAAAKKYSSCDKLLAVYPAGVARDSAAADAAQAAGMNRPTVNRGIYKTNAGRLDRDRDGVACEQPM